MNNSLVFLVPSSVLAFASAYATANEGNSNQQSGSSVNFGPEPVGDFLACSTKNSGRSLV